MIFFPAFLQLFIGLISLIAKHQRTISIRWVSTENMLYKTKECIFRTFRKRRKSKSNLKIELVRYIYQSNGKNFVLKKYSNSSNEKERIIYWENFVEKKKCFWKSKGLVISWKICDILCMKKIKRKIFVCENWKCWYKYFLVIHIFIDFKLKLNWF